MQTATLVRVESCTNAGGVSPVGFVDVTPLVNQLTARDSPTPHVTIHITCRTSGCRAVPMG